MKANMAADHGYEEYRELQLVELEMLLAFRDICDRHHLTYYLSGGTYLGAVRHKGFIPWDDDVDVAMPREDYERFVGLVNDELPPKMQFKSIPLDPSYHFTWSRIINNEVKVIVHNYDHDEVEPAWIDVFTLDGMPSNKLLMSLHKVRLLWRRVTYGWANYRYVSYNKKDRPWHERVLMFVGKTIKPGRWMTIQREYEKLEKALRKYPAKSSKYYMNFKGTYMFNSIMEKERYYGDGALYTFEGEQFNAPANYDAYLSKIYGDYMALPPKDKRNKHGTEIYH